MLGSRGSHPTPRHPLGRCEDCGQELSMGLEGTFCYRCEVRGEPLSTTDGRRVAERRVPDLRRSVTAAALTARAVWSLSGARA